MIFSYLLLFGFMAQLWRNFLYLCQLKYSIMIVLSFSYRSTKNEANLRLRFRYGSTSIEVPTKMEISKSFWDEYRKGKNFRDVHKSNLKKAIDEHIKELKKHVLNEIEKTTPDTIDKNSLKEILHNFYSPPTPEVADIIPNSLLGYWDYYTNLRRNEVGAGSKKVFATIKQKLIRFQKAEFKTFEIKDVNDDFKNSYIEYCKNVNYSPNTIRKDIKTIKAVCVHARKKGVKTSLELDDFSTKPEAKSIIYLSFEELEKIKAVEGLPDYLENARDWLIISCFTGQRVSDFMRFSKSMVQKVKGGNFLEIKQVKTRKDVTIPLMPEVIEILHKRNGDFPRAISDQRYNEYIKLVCEKAGINEITRGKIRECIADDKKKAKKSDYRGIDGEYPKWELVTSHIGRRSFASNFYGKIPTTYLRNITGHGTEQMLLAYIGKSSDDTASEAYELLMNVER